METATKISLIENLPLLNCLDEAGKQQFAACLEIRTKKKYAFIYMPDEASSHLFFLINGTVKISTHSSDGREVIKAILHPTAMFGELGLVGEESRQDFARAMNEDVLLCVIRVDDFQKLMESNHRLCLRVISMMGKRLRSAENRLESLIFKDARTRIVEFLKDSVVTRGRRVGYEMLLKHSLTQQDIANLTGTSRQTVTSVLNDLRKSDLIYFHRRSILVRDMAKLV
jgi:CRP/FNR family transcriptional regulator, cyclic AMP receptor protein